MKKITFELNGKQVSIVPEDPQMPLLYALRNTLELKGPKFGCGLGQCGACTVIIDGSAARSCLMPLSAMEKRKVQTLEGLAIGDRLHPVQQAFIDEQAAQCGYCTNGMVMAAKALLDKEKVPTEAQILEALEGHLCRCGTQPRVVQAVSRAAATLRK